MKHAVRKGFRQMGFLGHVGEQDGEGGELVEHSYIYTHEWRQIHG